MIPRLETDILKGFRDGAAGRRLIEKVLSMAGGEPVTFMEVCGTHTVEFFRTGLRKALSGAVRLVSGPGCPVCVTPNSIIDKAIAYAQTPGGIVATFGDMMRVPGSETSLERARAEGADVRIVYSTLGALEIARKQPDRRVVFMGIGFETTSPTVAASIIVAVREGLKNFAVLCSHKLVPPALEALASSGHEIALKGLLCPGHVSTIIGSNAYKFVAEKYRMPCVVTGFEPLDMIQGVMMLMEQARDCRAEVGVQYSRAVKPEGNLKALALLDRVFEQVDSEWRGFGIIPGGGYRIRDEYEAFDAERRWPVETPPPREHPGCRCAEILLGKIVPADCPLFRKKCSPESPVGACMVSSEGTCAAWYKYGDETV